MRAAAAPLFVDDFLSYIVQQERHLSIQEAIRHIEGNMGDVRLMQPGQAGKIHPDCIRAAQSLKVSGQPWRAYRLHSWADLEGFTPHFRHSLHATQCPGWTVAEWPANTRFGQLHPLS